MTYEDYCAEAKRLGFVAMSETAFHGWLVAVTHYFATDVPTRATPLLTPDPIAASEAKAETWRDRAPLL